MGWKDCAEHLGNDELKGVMMPDGVPAENKSGIASLQYNEVSKPYHKDYEWMAA